MNSTIFSIMLLVVFPCAVWGISALISRRETVQITGRATVKSHRSWLERGRKYRVCFELSDGSLLELRTIRSDYETLRIGQSGQLTWEEDLFLHFDPDIPQ